MDGGWAPCGILFVDGLAGCVGEKEAIRSVWLPTFSSFSSFASFSSSSAFLLAW